MQTYAVKITLLIPVKAANETEAKEVALGNIVEELDLRQEKCIQGLTVEPKEYPDSEVWMKTW